MLREQKILIAGAHGMVGRALTHRLQKEGFENLLLPKRSEIDFCDQNNVRDFFSRNDIDVVVIAAAKVGGIFANNQYPAEFLYENLMIGTHLIHEAHLHNISRLLYLGSSCIYPKWAPQPIQEDSLLTGALEPTNEAYAIAKIACLKLCQFYRKQYGRNYISAMPTNLYGPNDNYHPENAHVIPALIRRFHEAKVTNQKEVVIWGSGQALREFLYVDDLADALFFLLKYYNEPSHINVGSSCEVSIADLAMLIAEVVGFEGTIINDTSKPDGTLRKKCDLTKITQLGWQAKTSLKEGLKLTYADYLSQIYAREKK